MQILVFPNIFTALDKTGWPCGRTHVDPTTHPRPFDVFGGKIRRVVEKHDREDPDPKRRAELAKVDPRESRVRVLADVRLRAIPVELSQYIRERVASGDLIAADKQSALACGISSKSYHEPLVALEAAMQSLLADWRATHDPDDRPALSGHDLVMSGGEIKLAKREAKPRPVVEAEGTVPGEALDAAAAGLPTTLDTTSDPESVASPS